MNILFLHPNMPGQYKHLARIFGEEGKHRIFFITKHKTASLPGVERITYRVPREPSPHTHRYLTTTERAVLQGQEVWRVAKKLKAEKGFVPDIIVGHPGWGDALFIRDLFPSARMLGFFEFFYRAPNADVAFEPTDEPLAPDDFARVRMKNITNLASLEMVDWGVTPTIWQWSMHPEGLRHKISVLHDGVDIGFCRPDPGATFTLPNGTVFKPGDELITYVTRNFEPYRGFPTFMRAAEILLKERPRAHIVAVGADGVSYGRAAPKGTTYRQVMMKEVKLPPDRFHFLGPQPQEQLVKLFQVSAAHIYLTYPFVLSWSMLEAMASGVALVASSTKPVTEVVEDGRNGILADFFSPKEVAKKVIALLDAKDGNQAMRAAARETIVTRFDLKKTLPLHRQLLLDVAAGATPPPVAKEILAFSPIEPYRESFWHG